MDHRYSFIKKALLVCMLLCVCAVCSCAFSEAALCADEHAQITQDLIALLDADPDLYALVERSVAQAAAVNPDPVTNPVRTMEDYYASLDWSSVCMPWNILDTGSDSLYAAIDQSLDYFYFLLDQPLPELAGRGYYYPCLEYHEPIASWVRQYCAGWGEFLSTEGSWNDLYYARVCADADFHMDSGWYSGENIWDSFNDWFSRHLISPDARPVSDAAVVAPADSTPQGIWHIGEDSQLDMGVQLKSVRFYNAADIIGEGSAYRDAFAGGTLTHTFLDVNDYHRYHFPVSGTVLEVRKIPALDAVGGIISWDSAQGKYILWDENPGWQSIETRDCLIMETEYGLVAILPIAMSQVSSCNWEETVRVGAKVHAGDPMGYFLFGGSDIVMIFQAGVDIELLSTDHILMGQPYAAVR